MIPLSFFNESDTGRIRQVRGNPKDRQHLYDLGFEPGEEVSVICKSDENIVVSVKGIRFAIGSQAGSKIMMEWK